MQQLRQELASMQSRWKNALPNLESSPEKWIPANQGANVQQVTELIDAFVKFSAEIEAPQGIRPHFHVVKAGIATRAVNGTTQIDKLEQGNSPEHCEKFLESLIHISIYLNHLLTLSDDERRNTVGNALSTRLAESLSLMEGGQIQLSKKSAELEKAQDIIQEVESSKERIASFEGTAKSLIEDMEKRFEIEKQVESATQEYRERVRQQLDGLLMETSTVNQKAQSQWEIDADKMRVQLADIEQIKKLNAELAESLQTQKNTIAEIQKDTTRQKQQIDDLLPQGASAGLAAAFEERARRLDSTRHTWLIVFCLSIAGLIGVSFGLGSLFTGSAQVHNKEIWLELLERLPFVAPLVWVGWFSAVQYGNTIRVQEDYEFKAATSKAFAGYRDHMEHMAGVKFEEANSAMLLLAERTIEILAREPLRIYGKVDSDASPASGVKEMLLRGSKEKSTD